LAFDNNLDLNVNDIEIKEDNHVPMAIVHPVHPHHFICALSTVSRHIVESSAKNSKPKGFQETVVVVTDLLGSAREIGFQSFYSSYGVQGL
jgi:hypothetical protein